MKKRTLTSLALVLALAALTAGETALIPASAGAQGKVVVWNFPHISAPTYYHTVNYNAFAAKVKEKSQGRMRSASTPPRRSIPDPSSSPPSSTGAPRSVPSSRPISPMSCSRWARSSCRS